MCGKNSLQIHCPGKDQVTHQHKRIRIYAFTHPQTQGIHATITTSPPFPHHTPRDQHITIASRIASVPKDRKLVLMIDALDESENGYPAPISCVLILFFIVSFFVICYPHFDDELSHRVCFSLVSIQGKQRFAEVAWSQTWQSSRVGGRVHDKSAGTRD